MHSNDLTRRKFLTRVAVAAAAVRNTELGAQPRAVPIIDTHIHLFDPTRPQGAPYSGPRTTAGAAPQSAYPDRYRKLATPLGIVGAIKVEASPWIEDNLWVLEVAQRDTIIVGVIGNLEPDKPEFAEYLGRYAKNPLFRGIRYGNLWGRDMTRQSDNPAFIDGLKLLAKADFVVDTANPRVDLLEAVVRITDKVPDLRVVIDHLPSLEPTQETQARYDGMLREIQPRGQIYVKLSAVIHPVNGRIATEVAPYRDRLDHLIGVFGENRILFGSDWPNSDGVAPIDKVVEVVKAYFAAQPTAIREKYFWRNSVAAYKWIKREASQPGVP
jgi:L-fuconolactonase